MMTGSKPENLLHEEQSASVANFFPVGAELIQCMNVIGTLDIATVCLVTAWFVGVGLWWLYYDNDVEALYMIQLQCIDAM